MTATPPTYGTVRTLVDSERLHLLRAVRQEDQRTVLLKVLGPHPVMARDLARLENEYRIASRLDGSVAPRPLALDRHRGLPALVSEDVGGEPLVSLLGAPMEPGRFLRLASALARALAELHGQGVIHMDLQPESVLVDEGTGEVKLINFGLASLLSRQHQEPRNLVLVEGSLPYLSPEQTGRTNRPVDSRSDLYALGVIFYQMLTGRLPFQASDPIEWMHCHLARSPSPPAELVASVPAQLSAVVMKLLAKVAEQRYQTARGLLSDLERCRSDEVAEGAIVIFPLAQRDTPERFPIQQKLYGREAELALLLGDFAAVVRSGAPRLALIAGPAGIGKSTLASELHGPVLRERGFFVRGKCEEQQRGRPYSTMVQAFQQLVLEMLAEPEDRLAAWRKKIQAALGASGQVIVDVIPQLALVLGPQPPAPALPAAEIQNRFLTVFQQFADVFAERQHPMLMFLDDLQWADAASLRLLQHLLGQREGCYLFIVGAYRDAEVDGSHPVARMIRELGAAELEPRRIELGPLSRAELSCLIADAAACPPEEADSLAALVEERTAGNPFFATHYLDALHADGLLAFDPSARRWRWDATEIRATQHSENVVDLMIARLRRLRVESQTAVSRLAFLAGSVAPGTLATVLARSEEETTAALWEPVREGLVLRLDGVYRFVHDRVQQAAYLLVPEEERAQVHLELGRRLLERVTPEELEERLLDIVNQYNRASSLLGGTERIRAAELNGLAARKAKRSGAHDLAHRFYQAGLRLSDASMWESHYQLALSLHQEGAQAAYLSGDFAESQRLVDLTLERARTLLDRVYSYETEISHFIAQRRLLEATRCGLEALRLLGLNLPERPGKVVVGIALLRTMLRLAPRRGRIQGLSDLPEMRDPTDLAKMRILEAIGSAVYLASPELMPLVCLAGLDLSIRRGNCAESLYFYAGYGLLLCGVVGDIEAGYRFGRLAVDLLEGRPDAPALRTRIQFLFNNFIRHTREPLGDTLPSLMEGYHGGVSAGDFEYAARSLLVHGVHQFLMGEPLGEVSQSMESAAQAIARLGQATPLAYNRIYQQTVANLLGESPDPCRLVGRHLDEVAAAAEFAEANDRYAENTIHFNKLFLCYLFNRYGEALECSRAVDPTALTALSTMYQHSFYDSLACLAALGDLPATQRPRLLLRVARNQRRLGKWARHAPFTHLHRYHLVEAERAAVHRRQARADDLFEQAVEEAGRSGYLYEEGLAHERAALFYLSSGRARRGLQALRDARACYARWGAVAKVRDLEGKHPALRSVEGAPAAAAAGGIGPPMPDLNTALKACQTISEEMVLDRLVGKLMEIVVENAGADRGCLLLVRGEELRLVAEARVEKERIRVAPPLDAGDLGLVVPLSIINRVRRSRERVLVDDVQAGHLPAADPYLREHHPVSVLCLPILKQATLLGLLYLENSLVPGAFHAGRLATLEVLAAQAAISLESALLLEREQAARAAAEKAVRMRDEFLSIASHELKTPMTSLLLTLQALAPGSAATFDAETIGRLAEIAERQGGRLSRLIDELLDVTRIEQDRLSLELEELELLELVHEVVTRLGRELESAGCSTTVLGGPPVAGRWDRLRLEQVIMNLLSNAAKFGAGKPVEISVERRPRPAGGPLARLTVRDHGIGIDLEREKGIFERFGRGVSAKHYGGLGLGLYICHRIVEAHGGTIQVESQVGQGAAFTVEIPCDLTGGAS